MYGVIDKIRILPQW